MRCGARARDISTRARHTGGERVMSRSLQFTAEDIRRFAEWSADRNPLHVDAEFARGTYFGEPIVHGMLSVLRALEVDGEKTCAPALGLDIEFKGAVRPGTVFDVQKVEDRVLAHSPDAQVLAIRLDC